MTKAERAHVLDWSDAICRKEEEAKRIFEKLQEMCVKHGYGCKPCALEAMLEYLLTSNDAAVRHGALNLYVRYQRFSAVYESMQELCQGFADLSGKSFQIMKCDGTAHPDEHERRNCA